MDFVAVQYGHVINNRIHNSGDWCMYTKGGSAYLIIEGNEFYDCGTGGYSAGQGTGFQFMTSPWLHYEAYDIKVINNIIHDTQGAGLGVNGGYNILLAYNTLYRVGSNSHVLEVGFGSRSCDGQPGDAGRDLCGTYKASGGWGTTVVDDGTNFVRIPNKNIFIYNNIIYNPSGYQSLYQHFSIFGSYSGNSQTGSNVPIPTRADDNLEIRGNTIWNGTSDMPLGIEDPNNGFTGCQPGNSTCNAAQLMADNAINTIEPQIIDPANGNFRPVAGGNVFSLPTYIIPNFAWNDAPATPPVPAGNLNNSITSDMDGNQRNASNPPGAYAGPDNNCTAILQNNLLLYVPIIVYNGQDYWADFQYVQNTYNFTLVNAGLLTNTGYFNNCPVSVISQDLKLHMPSVKYNGLFYWADLQYTSGLIFTLTGAGQN